MGRSIMAGRRAILKRLRHCSRNGDLHKQGSSIAELVSFHPIRWRV
jgi:hypothetical protein